MQKWYGNPKQGVNALNDAERAALAEADEAVAAVIALGDFDPAELTGLVASKEQESSPKPADLELVRSI